MASKKKKIVLVLASIVGVGLIAGFFVLQFYAKHFITSNTSGIEDKMYIYIPRGSNQEDVLRILSESKCVDRMDDLQWLMEKKNYKQGNIVAGKYRLKNGMTSNELINHLRAGNGRLEVNVEFNQVRDLKQLAGKMTREVGVDSVEVYQWLSNPDSIGRYGFNEYTAISMFVPNTYKVTWDITVPELMKRMATEYKIFWNEDRKAKAKKCKLTQSEVVTLASIVYWETKKPKDMPTVAGVYINRLRKGWPLQADPTLIFAHGDYSIKRVLNVHKEIVSPYNTYTNAGLPPGPIILPPTLFIDAVLNYEEHQYMYFVAKEDFSGDSYFSKTLRQHEIYANRYRNALNKRKIYK